MGGGPKSQRCCGRHLWMAPFRQLPQEQEGRGRKRASIHSILQAGVFPHLAGRLTCGASGFGALSLSPPYQGQGGGHCHRCHNHERNARPIGHFLSPLRLSHNRCDRRSVGHPREHPSSRCPRSFFTRLLAVTLSNRLEEEGKRWVPQMGLMLD